MSSGIIFNLIYELLLQSSDLRGHPGIEAHWFTCSRFFRVRQLELLVHFPFILVQNLLSYVFHLWVTVCPFKLLRINVIPFPHTVLLGLKAVLVFP